jgi:diaminopimelate epimerase
MVGAGNDFVVVDNRRNAVPEGEKRARFIERVCHRRLSIGADGVLLVENAPGAHFRMRYYNSDGGEAEMCGNGGRCIARYAFLHGIAPADMEFLTVAGRHEAHVRGTSVKLGMTDPHSLRLNLCVPLTDRARTLHVLNTGVPHAVEIVDDVGSVEIVRVGREIRNHEEFRPAGTNANFITPINRNSFAIRTYERGVEDETLACGTGTTAAAILGSILGLFDSPVVGTTRSGLPLTIHFERNGESVSSVFLEGNAEAPFSGTIALD